MMFPKYNITTILLRIRLSHCFRWKEMFRRNDRHIYCQKITTHCYFSLFKRKKGLLRMNWKSSFKTAGEKLKGSGPSWKTSFSFLPLPLEHKVTFTPQSIVSYFLPLCKDITVVEINVFHLFNKCVYSPWQECNVC